MGLTSHFQLSSKSSGLAQPTGPSYTSSIFPLLSLTRYTVAGSTQHKRRYLCIYPRYARDSIALPHVPLCSIFRFVRVLQSWDRHVPSKGSGRRPNWHVTMRSEFDRLRELRSLSFLAAHRHDRIQPLVDGMPDLPPLQPAMGDRCQCLICKTTRWRTHGK